MNIRSLALALAATVGLASLAQAEIVVLVNGNRMDVKSYEIQTNVVVVMTWDGKIQSFPITWVDIEATKSVSHQGDPAAGLPPERVDKARRLLAGFGVKDAVAGLFAELEVEIRSLHAGTTRPTYDVVRGAFRNAYDGERIFDVIVADFAKEADDALLDRWSQWMSRPETQQILAMENAKPGDNDGIDKSRYLAEMYSNPEMAYRHELLARLDKALVASEAGLEIAATLAGSLQDARQLVLASPPPHQSVEQIRDRLWPTVQRRPSTRCCSPTGRRRTTS